jgi:hypothetical protein
MFDNGTLEYSLPGLISFGLQIILPILVGLVTTRVTSARTKFILLAVLTAITQFLTEFALALNAGQAFRWQDVLVNVIAGFLVSVGVHFGAYKPTGVTGGDSWAERHGAKTNYDMAR